MESVMNQEPASVMADHVLQQLDKLMPKNALVLGHVIVDLIQRLERPEQRKLAVTLAERVLRGRA
jgi:hypothetical protein